MTTKVTVYSRRGCHLCELMLEELEPLLRGRSAELVVVDVDLDEALKALYGLRVPVLAVDGRTVCEARLDPQSVLAAIGR